MKKFRIISLVIFLITTFVSLDLLINLLGSMIPEMNDGIGTHSILWGILYFGDSLWSRERFFNAFIISSLISCAVLIENIVLIVIDILKKDR